MAKIFNLFIIGSSELKVKITSTQFLENLFFTNPSLLAGKNVTDIENTDKTGGSSNELSVLRFLLDMLNRGEVLVKKNGNEKERKPDESCLDAANILANDTRAQVREKQGKR